MKIVFKDTQIREVFRLNTFDLHKSHNMKHQKVTTIIQYKSTEMVVITLSNGYVAALDLLKMQVTNLTRFHKGNPRPQQET